MVGPFGTCIRIDNPLSFPARSGSTSIDLSKATKLRDVVFRLGSWNVNWVTRALRTVTPEPSDLRQISIRVAHHLTPSAVGTDPRQTFGEGIFGQWAELDGPLVQFWESRSVRSNVVCLTLNEAKPGTKDFMERLLPLSTAMGITGLDECYGMGTRLYVMAKLRRGCTYSKNLWSLSSALVVCDLCPHYRDCAFQQVPPWVAQHAHDTSPCSKLVSVFNVPPNTPGFCAIADDQFEADVSGPNPAPKHTRPLLYWNRDVESIPPTRKFPGRKFRVLSTFFPRGCAKTRILRLDLLVLVCLNVTVT